MEFASRDISWYLPFEWSYIIQIITKYQLDISQWMKTNKNGSKKMIQLQVSWILKCWVEETRTP